MIKIITFILLISLIFSETIDSQINKNETSLKNIEFEIQNLEKTLNQQLADEKNTEKELKSLREKVNREKAKLLENEISQGIQYGLIKKSNDIIDSLQSNLQNIIIQKNDYISIIQKIKTEKRATIKLINDISEDLKSIQIEIDKGLKKINIIKEDLKEIGLENLILDSPNNLQFIFESETLKDFILYNTLYEMLIEQQSKNIIGLINLKENEENKYDDNLVTKSKYAKKLNLFSKNKAEYEQILLKINSDYEILDALILDKEKVLDNITLEYKSLGVVIKSYKNRINNLKDNKKKILETKKNAAEERQRIEYSLILKKEARDRIDNEIKKLFKKSTNISNSNIYELKSSLPWPIEGKVITRFGISTTETGTKFDYSSIEIVNDELAYITSLINPNKPNKNIVKKFQRKTMNMKSGDFGYGVFGPKTTKKWKEYNNKINNDEKVSIISIHEGTVEGVYFIDPLTGVAIMIRHDDNSISAYSGHIDPIVVEEQIVRSGQKIGEINKKNILAFQLWINNKAVNPENWLIKK